MAGFVLTDDPNTALIKMPKTSKKSWPPKSEQKQMEGMTQ
jgi:hypothetical protein